MQNEILSIFPNGKLKTILQEIIVANGSLSNKQPVYGFHFKFYVPGWIGFIQECIVESKMQKFYKTPFYADRGYIDFANWIVDKASEVAKCYNEIETLKNEDKIACKKMVINIFNATIENWMECCPEIATYCNIDFDGNVRISPMGFVHYRLASSLKNFGYTQFDSNTSKSSLFSEVKAQGMYIIGYILNVILLACIWGILIAIFK